MDDRRGSATGCNAAGRGGQGHGRGEGRGGGGREGTDGRMGRRPVSVVGDAFPGREGYGSGRDEEGNGGSDSVKRGNAGGRTDGRAVGRADCRADDRDGRTDGRAAGRDGSGRAAGRATAGTVAEGRTAETAAEGTEVPHAADRLARPRAVFPRHSVQPSSSATGGAGEKWMERLGVETSGASAPAFSMVNGCGTSAMAAALVPEFCACGATTCRADRDWVVGESTQLASRA